MLLAHDDLEVDQQEHGEQPEHRAGGGLDANLAKQKAHWLTADTIAWNIEPHQGGDYAIHSAENGGLAIESGAITGGQSIATNNYLRFSRSQEQAADQAGALAALRPVEAALEEARDGGDDAGRFGAGDEQASAVGEAAPLIVVGAVTGFFTRGAGLSPGNVADPCHLGERFVALPTTITEWAKEPSPEFKVANASATILAMLVFVLLINSIAIVLRNRFEKKRST